MRTHHDPECPPASYTPTSCACGFTAEFIATPRCVDAWEGEHSAPYSQRCFFCGGPAHPATGCQYSERVIACHACTVNFWAWFRAAQHVRGRPGRDRRGHVQADFYTAAGRK